MNEKLMQEILQQAPLGYAYHQMVYTSDGIPEDYIFLDVNPAFEEMTGLKREEIIGKRVTEVLPEIRKGCFDWVEFYGRAVLSGEKREFIQYAEPLKRWYKVTSFTFGKDQFVTLFHDFGRGQIPDHLSRDNLTGLFNRQFMEGKLKEIASTELPFALLIADVNGLKLVNDAFGCEAGDKLLREAAAILKESCREKDILARWDGDEFLALLPDCTSEIAEHIVKQIKAKSQNKKTRAIPLSISTGYATREFRTQKLSDLLKKAEGRMYRQKLSERKSCRSAVISTILAALYAKSTETEEHGERLKNYCHAIGEKLGLSPDEIDELSLLALLHDIGKIGIRESVLQKPGPLTEKEWEEMKKHPEIGFQIVQNIPELSTIAKYILFHHERYDGRGYPKGLKGEEIPLPCRILAVADAYDAMVNDRPYRKSLHREDAVAEIEKNAGTQFDPEVVGVFLNLFERAS